MSEFLEAVPEVEVGGQGGVAMTLPPIERIRFEVWALAWPVIISFGLDSILGLSSMLMVGRLGADAVGAVGLATQILGAVRAGIAAVGTGTVALVARYIGASDRDSAEDVLKQSVVFGVLVSLAPRPQKTPDSRKLSWIPGQPGESVERPQGHSALVVRCRGESTPA